MGHLCVHPYNVVKFCHQVIETSMISLIILYEFLDWDEKTQKTELLGL